MGPTVCLSCLQSDLADALSTTSAGTTGSGCSFVKSKSSLSESSSNMYLSPDRITTIKIAFAYASLHISHAFRCMYRDASWLAHYPLSVFPVPEENTNVVADSRLCSVQLTSIAIFLQDAMLQGTSIRSCDAAKIHVVLWGTNDTKARQHTCTSTAKCNSPASKRQRNKPMTFHAKVRY